MELLAVVAVMAVVAVLAVTRIGGLVQRSHFAAAEADAATIRDALAGEGAGYLCDMWGLAGLSLADIRLANLLAPTNIYVAADSVGGVFPLARRLEDVGGGNGLADASAFTSWDERRGRGWRGPYVRGKAGTFPVRDEVHRSFYPDVANLYVPADFAHHRDISIYGYPGEPAILDPWGNPYVLQVPPPQAFTNANVATVTPETRLEYARIVSAGADGKIDTPCFYVNATNDVTISVWSDRTRRLVRQAGLIDGDDRSSRGDDIVVFLHRNDIDEEGR